MNRLKSRWIMISVLSIMVLHRCTVRNPEESLDVYPEIVRVDAPVHIAFGSGKTVPVYVRVSDSADIVSVILTVADTIETLDLTDTGSGGDLISGDGVFTGGLNAAVFPDTGNYALRITAEDRDGYEAIWDGSVTVGHFPWGEVPVLKTITVPESVDSTGLTAFRIAVEVGNPPESGMIDSVQYRIYPPLSPVPVFTGLLAEDGAGGETPGDGLYSATVNLAEPLKGLGQHLIRFQAWNAGGASLPEVRRFTIAGVNDPPVLFGLNVKSKVNRLNSPPFMISVSAADPQGTADIRRVYFNSVKPDGTPAGGNPFLLRDDGEAGDIEAGDHIYSLIIQISPDNELGIYTFTFYAEDLSGALSQPLVHELTVTEEGEN